MFTDDCCELTQPFFQATRNLWTAETRLHEDHTFGSLTLESITTSRFNIRYDDWKIHLDVPTASIAFETVSSMPTPYIIERISLPLLRLLRGCTLLHASCAAIHGGAVALIAESGIGKSTLIAGLLDHAECQLIADDITTIAGGTVLPISSQIGMRHAMFDDASYVQNIEYAGSKKLLTLKSAKVETQPLPLKQLIFLESGDPTIPNPVPFFSVLPVLLRQQMSLSNPPQAFTRLQFQTIMALQSIPCFKMRISCVNRTMVEKCCAFIIDNA